MPEPHEVGRINGVMPGHPVGERAEVADASEHVLVISHGPLTVMAVLAGGLLGAVGLG